MPLLTENTVTLKGKKSWRMLKSAQSGRTEYLQLSEMCCALVPMYPREHFHGWEDRMNFSAFFLQTLRRGQHLHIAQFTSINACKGPGKKKKMGQKSSDF